MSVNARQIGRETHCPNWMNWEATVIPETAHASCFAKTQACYRVKDLNSTKASVKSQLSQVPCWPMPRKSGVKI